MPVPILTVPKNGLKTVESLGEVIATHALGGALFAADFYVSGSEAWEPVPGGWRHGAGDIINVDHHAPHPSMRRHVSSANLALDLVATGRRPGEQDAIVVSHMDCDSILSAGILAGRLEPKQDYGAAAIAADHTGEEHPIADLLQALDAHWSRSGRPVPDPDGLEYFFECLERLEEGRALDDFAREASDRRSRNRSAAEDVARDRMEFERGVAFAVLDDPVESELLLPHLDGVWVAGTANPSREHSGRWQIKLRLASDAPSWLSLQDLGIESFDLAYGGRWNAGSNNRRGGSDMPPEQYRVALVAALDARLLERAIEIAVEAHRGQRDRAGAPYILHPLRVMASCGSVDARIVGALHDVVEDSSWTVEALAKQGFSTQLLSGLAAVTKRPDEEGSDEGYFRFCRRAAAHLLGREVKRADLLDNMDVTRLGPSPTEKDLMRLERYREALEILESA